MIYVLGHADMLVWTGPSSFSLISNDIGILVETTASLPPNVFIFCQWKRLTLVTLSFLNIYII